MHVKKAIAFISSKGLIRIFTFRFLFISAPTSSRKRKYQSLSRPTKLFQYDKANTSLKPLTVGKQQDLILRFLCPISEYQEVKELFC